MAYIRTNYYNINSIIKFYSTLKNVDFTTLTIERKAELDASLKYYDYYFKSQNAATKFLLSFTAEKMTASAKRFGAITNTEKAYFFIKMVDPTLKFLEIYESANLRAEMKLFCHDNFGFYDRFLMHLEKLYNDVFMEYTSDELWSRDSIRKIRVPKKNL